MMNLYQQVSENCSKIITRKYSTSFSLGIMLLDKKMHSHIYAIYGFVRLADEIVDTFHEHDKVHLLKEYRKDTFRALQRGISLNPVLHAFQETVNEFSIDHELISIFLDSMEMDLHPHEYNQEKYEQYILGSAEVVGLMCLKVFCEGDEKMYKALSFEAMKLGSAFQKINFLRDLKSDYQTLGRVYFPGIDMAEFNDKVKKGIEEDIAQDFATGYEGILKLPKKARFGVYVAYVYYYALFQRIKSTPAEVVMQKRIRINNYNKYGLLLSSYFRHSFNLL